MKDYIKSWLPKLQKYSLDLDKLSKIYNQPWVLVDNIEEFVKIIFQEKGKLIVSKNGFVSEGKWELISMANSLLLDINGEKKLYNHQFIDGGLMILNLDGFSNDYFILANQNLIPDLDILGYLKSKYSKPIKETTSPNSYTTTPKPLYELEYPLKDGRLFQIVKFMGYSGNTVVKINHELPANGLYRSEERNRVYEVQNGKLVMEYTIVHFKQNNGDVLEVASSWLQGIVKGCHAWINNKPAPDGIYKTGWLSKVKVVGGKLV